MATVRLLRDHTSGGVRYFKNQVVSTMPDSSVAWLVENDLAVLVANPAPVQNKPVQPVIAPTARPSWVAPTPVAPVISAPASEIIAPTVE